uniref:Uncharacterized protein AlNc14C5G678 n=1 Tax=Albugo laibachii Nc14 TaxID=890382 RepID=F0W0P3_9STRA|nr:conserved hypothetical protein [Albugo laibachii Nc14]|eukprot:CCA14617.1 conserved hypothetical protein [Albugo laibachii Nc14]
MYDITGNKVLMEVAVEDAESLSYHRFCEQYIERNRPVRIINITQGWSCSSSWKDVTGSLNYEYLLEMYGEELVPIVEGQTESHETHSRTLVNFREYLQQVESQAVGLKYLKDWHFFQCCQKRGFKPEYTTPIFFQDDWLNWWSDQKEALHQRSDDYRFLYFGPAGSWTPMHHDVLCSYSWSVNICGRKRWLLFAPEDVM